MPFFIKSINVQFAKLLGDVLQQNQVQIYTFEQLGALNQLNLISRLAQATLDIFTVQFQTCAKARLGYALTFLIVFLLVFLRLRLVAAIYLPCRYFLVASLYGLAHFYLQNPKSGMNYFDRWKFHFYLQRLTFLKLSSFQKVSR